MQYCKHISVKKLAEKRQPVGSNIAKCWGVFVGHFLSKCCQSLVVKVTCVSKSCFAVKFSLFMFFRVVYAGRDVPCFNGCCVCKHDDEFSLVSFCFWCFHYMNYQIPRLARGKDNGPQPAMFVYWLACVIVQKLSM